MGVIRVAGNIKDVPINTTHSEPSEINKPPVDGGQTYIFTTSEEWVNAGNIDQTVTVTVAPGSEVNCSNVQLTFPSTGTNTVTLNTTDHTTEALQISADLPANTPGAGQIGWEFNIDSVWS